MIDPPSALEAAREPAPAAVNPWATAAFVVLTAMVALAQIIMGHDGFSLLHWDSHAYLPPAIVQARGDGLRNPLWGDAEDYDATGQRRFLYHGPLFQLLLAALLPAADSAAVLGVLGWLQALTTLVCAGLFYTASRPGRCCRWGWLAAFLGVLVMAAAQAYLAGRPEALVMLFVALAAWCQLSNLPPPVAVTLSAVLLGLTVITAPTSAILGGLALLAWYAQRHPLGELLIRGVASALIAGLTAWVLLWLFYPYPITEWIAGVRQHGAAQTGNFNFALFWPAWMANAALPLNGLLWLLALAGVADQYRRDWNRHGLSLLSVCLLVLFAWAQFYSAVQFSARLYNAVGLLPLVGAVILRCRADLAAAARWPVVIHVLLAACLASTAFGFVRHVLLYRWYLSDGMSLAQARALAEPYIKDGTPADPIYVTSALWMLSEDYEQMSAFLTRHRKPRVILVQEQMNAMFPTELDGFGPRQSYHVGTVPTLLGWPLADGMPGYQFAVYVRNSERQ